MEIPKPPEDHDLKNIIDKLANFVARNGPEFEEMTKQKQKDNPKFSFLFGGEFYNYYQYKVNSERVTGPAIPTPQQTEKLAQQHAIVQQVITQQAIQTAPWQQPQPPPHTVQFIQQQQHIQEQIQESEKNLDAQYQSLIQQQQVQIEETIARSQQQKLELLSKETDIPLEDLDQFAQPIIESCTKDNISAGKNWVFAHNHGPKQGDLIAQYLMSRITAKDATFEMRLHLIYLINDVLHHCMRKNAEDLKKSIGTVIIPIFCSAHVGVDVGKQSKLTKLLSLWDQNKYFDENTLEQLKDPATAMSTYQASLITENAQTVTSITQAIQEKYSQLHKQHQEFCNHLNKTLQQLLPPTVTLSQPPPGQIGQAIPTSQIQLGSAIPTIQSSHGSTVSTVIGPPGLAIPTLAPPTSAPPPNVLPGPLPSMSGPPPPFPPIFNQPPPNFSQPPPGYREPPPLRPPFEFGPGPVVQDYNHGQRGGPPPIPLPDISKPPPGFPVGPPPPIMPNDADLMPTCPYFELPAGLMAPLVKLEDCDYKPLDPNDIRLPPPMPPSERLLLAVEAFYSSPSHERPRDAEGWEKLGLLEFFKAKQNMKKIKAENMKNQPPVKNRSRSRSRSKSPLPNLPARRSRSYSPPLRTRRRYSRSRSKSRSPTPPPREDSPLPYQRSSRSKSHSRSRSRSQSRSSSRSPQPASRSPRVTSRKKSPSRSPSPPPPMFSGPFYQSPTDSKLGQENKGHQLLKKMGWGGAGLGAREQGIVDPIQESEVRDKVDMYKGVGMNMADPFEQFRKNKAQTFIQRMRAREETLKAIANPDKDSTEKEKPKKEPE